MAKGNVALFPPTPYRTRKEARGNVTQQNYSLYLNSRSQCERTALLHTIIQFSHNYGCTNLYHLRSPVQPHSLPWQVPTGRSGRGTVSVASPTQVVIKIRRWGVYRMLSVLKEHSL